MNLSVNVNINAAPELVGVLQALTAALTGAKQIQTALALPVTPALSVTPVTPALPVTQEPVPVQPAAPINQAAPTAVITPAPAPAAVPTTAPAYTMDQLAVAATQLVDAGRRNDLVALLTSFGVQALTALPKEQYGNFATQLRAMGAKI